MKLITRITKKNLSDEYGEYEVYYTLWYKIRDIALPFRITFWADVQTFSILCFHFERCKRRFPREINSCSKK